MKPKQILIVGTQRSGTSLIASYLGAHSKINMLCEDIGKNINRLYGKPYQANKLILHIQVRAKTKKNIFKSIFTHLFWRAFPTCKLSLQDYIDSGAKIIIITRNSDAVIRSMMKRSGYSYQQAENEYARGIEIINWLYTVTRPYEIKYEDLIKNRTFWLTMICGFLDIDFEIGMLKGEDYNFIYN